MSQHQPDAFEVSVYWWSAAWTPPGLRSDGQQIRFRIVGTMGKNAFHVDLVEALDPMPLTKRDRNAVLRAQLLTSLGRQIRIHTGQDTIKRLTWDKIDMPVVNA